VRALIISSSGRHFCAGMDLDFFPEVRKQETEDAGRYREWIRRKILFLQRALTRLEEIRVPVIAAVHGGCLGAGLDLACATNLRFCTSDAFFSIHEINIGMTADLGVLQRLPKLLPSGLAHELAYTGRRLEATEALGSGFVNRVFADHAQLLAHVHELAAQIGDKSPLAIAGSKLMLNRARDGSVAEGLELISLWNAAMFVTDDVPNALAAQKQKSKPVFADLLP
jgi:enoyl-CoA hydratase/carnithine racemase